jgi:hypothetical protein
VNHRCGPRLVDEARNRIRIAHIQADGARPLDRQIRGGRAGGAPHQFGPEVAGGTGDQELAHLI